MAAIPHKSSALRCRPQRHRPRLHREKGLFARALHGAKNFEVDKNQLHGLSDELLQAIAGSSPVFPDLYSRSLLHRHRGRPGDGLLRSRRRLRLLYLRRISRPRPAGTRQGRALHFSFPRRQCFHREIARTRTDSRRTSRLDVDSAPVRFRLNSTAIHVRHSNASGSAKELQIAYMRGGKLQSVVAKNCVLACYNGMIPYVCPELPEKQKEALSYLVKAPL